MHKILVIRIDALHVSDCISPLDVHVLHVSDCIIPLNVHVLHVSDCISPSSGATFNRLYIAFGIGRYIPICLAVVWL